MLAAFVDESIPNLSSIVLLAEAGGKTMRQRAQEKALDILERHKPEPLTEDVIKKLDQIVAQAGQA